MFRRSTLILFFLLLCFAFAGAAKGPEYYSLRAHGMGGAFIGLAEGREALYYNPAGLNLKDRFENFEKYPEMGYMPKQRYEFRLFSASIGVPANELSDVVDICGAPTVGTVIKKLLFFEFSYLKNAKWCPDIIRNIPDNINDPPNDELKEAMDKLAKLDRRLFETREQISLLEFSMHNFGFAVWMNNSLASYYDVGILVPGFGYETVQTDAVIQAAGAFSLTDDWSAGVGLKMAKRHKEQGTRYLPTLDLSDINEPKIGNRDELDSLQNFWENYAGDSLANMKSINLGLDFGVLYQLTREVRLGSSLRNVFFGELAGESITPNLSIGAAYSPMLLQSNSWWARKVHFAADYADILDGTVGDMFFSHLNFGAEAEQVALPSPLRDMPLSQRAAFGAAGGLVSGLIGFFIGDDFVGKAIGLALGTSIGVGIGSGGDLLRFSVGAGFEGGYSAWNFGVHSVGNAVSMRFGSYAEERGTRTGQKEQRFWTSELSVGF